LTSSHASRTVWSWSCAILRDSNPPGCHVRSCGAAIVLVQHSRASAHPDGDQVRKTGSLLLLPEHLAKTRDRIELNPSQRITIALPPLQRFSDTPLLRRRFADVCSRDLQSHCFHRRLTRARAVARRTQDQPTKTCMILCNEDLRFISLAGTRSWVHAI
jgi:hypothetical protein